MHAFDLTTPYGVLKFHVYRHNQGGLTGDAIVVDGVEYDYGHVLTLKDGKWIGTADQRIRRKNSNANQRPIANSVYERLEKVVQALNEKWEELDNFKKRNYQIQAEMAIVQNSINDHHNKLKKAEEELKVQAEELQKLEAILEKIQQGIFD